MKWLTLLTALVLVGCAHTAPRDDLRARVDRVLDAAVAEHRIVGGVVLVSIDGRLVYQRAVGYADREAKIAMREEAIFLLSSVSKPFVAIAALKLVDSGQLDLDDPVTKYLPTFQPHLADGTTPVITIRHLLTHTSGLTYTFLEPADGPYHKAHVSSGLDQPGLSFAENLARINSAPLVASPGTKWSYSMSTDILGEVVAKAANMPLPQAIATLVTNPLGLRDTAFTVSDAERLAVAYADHDGGPVRMGSTHDVPFAASALSYAPARIFDPASYPSGGAGMAGSAHDLLTFLEAVRLGDSRIVSATAADSVVHDQLRGADASNLGEGTGFSFIGAVVVDPSRAGSPANPNSVDWGGAYGHSWLMDREGKVVIVLLTNTAIEGMSGRLPTDLQHAVYAR